MAVSKLFEIDGRTLTDLYLPLSDEYVPLGRF
jgi:hypothetical protein